MTGDLLLKKQLQSSCSYKCIFWEETPVVTHVGQAVGFYKLYVGHKCRILYAFNVSLLRHFDRMFKWLRIGDGMHVISTSKSPQDFKSQHSCAALSLIEPDDFVQTCSAQLAFSCASIKMDVWVDALWISIINSFKWTILLILVF